LVLLTPYLADDYGSLPLPMIRLLFLLAAQQHPVTLAECDTFHFSVRSPELISLSDKVRILLLYFALFSRG
jgi:hypothetical protein